MKVAMASCHRMALGVGGIASPSLRKNQKSTMICVVCRNIGSSEDVVCGLCSAPLFFSAAQAASRITVSGIKFPSHGDHFLQVPGTPAPVHQRQDPPVRQHPERGGAQAGSVGCGCDT